MRKVFAFIALLGVAYALAVQQGLVGSPGSHANQHSEQGCDEQRLTDAYSHRERRVEVCGHGTLTRVLADDLQGSRHQRFVVRLSQGQTLLIAYNIDLAPRIEGLRPGRPIEFAGEYEWNPQGGVVHWTHRDPEGRHAAGWIHYEGHTYQ